MRFLSLTDNPIQRGNDEFTFVIGDDNIDFGRVDKGSAYLNLHHTDNLVGRIMAYDTEPGELYLDFSFWKDTPDGQLYADRYEDGKMKNVSVEIGAREDGIERTDRHKYRVNEWELIGAALTGAPADPNTGPAELAAEPTFTFKLTMMDGDATVPVIDIKEPEAEESPVPETLTKDDLAKAITENNQNLIGSAVEAFATLRKQEQDEAAAERQAELDEKEKRRKMRAEIEAEMEEEAKAKAEASKADDDDDDDDQTDDDDDDDDEESKDKVENRAKIEKMATIAGGAI